MYLSNAEVLILQYFNRAPDTKSFQSKEKRCLLLTILWYCNKCLLSSASFTRKVRMRYVFYIYIFNKLINNTGSSKYHLEFFMYLVKSKKTEIMCFSEQRSANQEYLGQFSMWFQYCLKDEVLQINFSSMHSSSWSSELVCHYCF